MNKEWMYKLVSRKMWLAIIAVLTIVLTAFLVPEISVEQICELVMAGATVIAYIIGEGLVDSVKPNSVTWPIDWKKKLLDSRFVAALVTFITLMLLIFKVPDITIEQVAAILPATATAMSYIIGKGITDKGKILNSNGGD